MNKTQYNKYYALLENEMLNESCDCITCNGCDCGCHSTEDDIIVNDEIAEEIAENEEENIEDENSEELESKTDCSTCSNENCQGCESNPEDNEEDEQEESKNLQSVYKPSPAPMKMGPIMSFEAFKNKK
jgi:Fe-S-cluster-containing dehydrogenase component